MVEYTRASFGPKMRALPSLERKTVRLLVNLMISDYCWVGAGCLGSIIAKGQDGLDLLNVQLSNNLIFQITEDELKEKFEVLD